MFGDIEVREVVAPVSVVRQRRIVRAGQGKGVTRPSRNYLVLLTL